MLTYEKAKEYFDYDMVTGELTWRITLTGHIQKGRKAGWLGNGYRQVTVEHKTYQVHRVIWLLVYGEWPKHHIDHELGVKHDNRICNLRDVSQRENSQNKTRHREGKLVGAMKNRRSNKLTSSIRIGTKRVYLGTFDTEQEAHEEYVSACAKVARGEKVQSKRSPYMYSRTKKMNHFRARIEFKGKDMSLGCYRTSDLANKAKTEVIRHLRSIECLHLYVPSRIRFNPETEVWTADGLEFDSVIKAIDSVK